MIFKRAVIVGHSGQDGQILTQQLMSTGCQVLGISKNSFGYAGSSGVATPFDPFDAAAVRKILSEFRPDAVFFLAAYHNSSEDNLESPASLIEKTYAVAEKLLVVFLEAVRIEVPECHFLFAATSHIFMNSPDSPQTEASAFAPDSVYGYAKLNGLYLARYYREKAALHVSTAILYNHESEFRSAKFISTKLMVAALQAKRGLIDKIEIGSLAACTDWGYAYDYCNGMATIAAGAQPGEFVVATGVLHSVEDLARIAFNQVGLNYRDYVVERTQMIRNVTGHLVGNSAKLRAETGWQPSVPFEIMIGKIMEKLAAANVE